MHQIERLRRDHSLLRNQIKMAAALLEMGPDAWFAVRRVCFTLSQQLKRHIRHREALEKRLAKSVSSRDQQTLASRRCHERQILVHIHRLFLDPDRRTIEDIRRPLLSYLRILERNMQQEEETFIAAAEALLDAAPGIEEPVPGLSETMTLREVLDRYPGSRGILEGLFIECELEGVSCLDELAWRHGMDFEDLARRLEPAVTAGPMQGAHKWR